MGDALDDKPGRNHPDRSGLNRSRSGVYRILRCDVVLFVHGTEMILSDADYSQAMPMARLERKSLTKFLKPDIDVAAQAESRGAATFSCVQIEIDHRRREANAGTTSYTPELDRMTDQEIVLASLTELH